MEVIAWAMHKYVMHGFLWKLHRDHHSKEHRAHSFLEFNDSFFILFSIMAIAAFSTWSWTGSFLPLGIGIGISLYGAVYFIIHDVFIHQRISIFKRTNIPYFKAIRFAHKVHHKQRNKEDGACFGMLWVPLKYYKMYMSESSTSKRTTTQL